MGKRIAGILMIVLGLVACGGVELPQSTGRTAPATSIPTQTQTSTTIPTENAILITGTPTATQTPLISKLQLTHDLIWFESGGIRDGHLMLWNASNNEIEILAGEDIESLIGLPGKIIDFDFKSNAVLVTLEVENNESLYYELGSIDLEDKEYLPLVATSSSEVEMVDIALSPNGRWAAYVIGELDEDQPDNGRTHYSRQELLVFRISSNPIPVLFGACEPDTLLSCISSLSWSEDNSILAWRGPGGMWTTELGEESELVLPDHYGRDETDDLRYFPSSWSPNSRYLIVRVGGWESTRYAMYDIIQNRYTRIPYIGFSYGGPQWSTAWLPNGQFIVAVGAYVAYHEEPPAIIPAKIVRFSIDPELEQKWFYEVGVFELASEPYDELHLSTQSDWQSIEFLRVRMYKGDLRQESVLLHLLTHDTRNEMLVERNQIMVDYSEYFGNTGSKKFLAESGRGVPIYLNERHFLITSDGKYADIIQDFVGEHACCFAWVDK